MNKEITIEELRIIQIGLLDEVHKFCIDNNLRYSLGGGTLLGAVRHKGFIPWDDDVDIMMPRPDYEQFLQNFRHDVIKIQHPGNTPNATITFAKLYDSQTILREYYATNGVFIDVFPIDGLPDEYGLFYYLNDQSKWINYLYKISDYENSKFYLYETNKPRWIVGLKYWLLHLTYPSRKKCLNKLRQLHNSYDFDSSFYAGAICGAYGDKEHMIKDTFTSYILLPFEGKEYMSIADYDTYLRKHYGDYMKLPPKESQQRSHHFEAYWIE